MSADWFFMKTGFFNRHKAIGPINETEFLTRIEKGDVTPSTMVSSNSKTHGRWIAMREVNPAYMHWKQCHPNSTDAA